MKTTPTSEQEMSDWADTQNNARNIIERIQKAASLNKGIRLSAYDVFCLNATVFTEGNEISGDYDGV